MPFPLAVQVARLFGPLLLVITALGIAATLFRAQLDRLVVRFARSIVVMVGLSEEALPLVRRLATDLPRRTVLAVLVAGESPLVKLTRQIGARVVVSDLDDARACGCWSCGSAASRCGRSTSCPPTSRPTCPGLGGSATSPTPVRPRSPSRRRGSPRGSTTRGRRSTGAAPTPTGRRPATGPSVRWVSDALSVYEVTAALLVGHVQTEPHDRVAVVGRSPLALAICAELAQRQREGSVLGRQPRPSFAELVLVGPGAADLRAQHKIRQERFGNAAEAAAITVEPIEATEPASPSCSRATRPRP